MIRFISQDRGPSSEARFQAVPEARRAGPGCSLPDERTKRKRSRVPGHAALCRLTADGATRGHGHIPGATDTAQEPQRSVPYTRPHLGTMWGPMSADPRPVRPGHSQPRVHQDPVQTPSKTRPPALEPQLRGPGASAPLGRRWGHRTPEHPQTSTSRGDQFGCCSALLWVHPSLATETAWLVS